MFEVDRRHQSPRPLLPQRTVEPRGGRNRRQSHRPMMPQQTVVPRGERNHQQSHRLPLPLWAGAQQRKKILLRASVSREAA